MISDLRATLQETHAPAARWAAMMAWLKRWWPALGPGAQEEAVAYLSGHADRLADRERVAPDWLVRELMWCPDSPLGVLPRRTRVVYAYGVPGLLPVLRAQPRLRLSLNARVWHEAMGAIDPAQVAEVWWQDHDEAPAEAAAWLASLHALERVEAVATSASRARWVFAAVSQSARTLRRLEVDVPGLPSILALAQGMPELSELAIGSYHMDQSWLSTPQAAGQMTDVIQALRWPETLRAVRVYHAGMFAQIMDALYTPALGAQLTECFIPSAITAPELERLWANHPRAEALIAGGWRALGEPHVEVIAPRLSTLKTLHTAGRAEPLVRRLIRLDDSALEDLVLSELEQEGTHALDRWLAARPPRLRNLHLSVVEPHDLDALAEGARRGAFAHLEAWGGDDHEEEALLHMLGAAPGALPRLSSLFVEGLLEDRLKPRLLALQRPPPTAMTRVSFEPIGGPETTSALLDWLAGAPVTYLELDRVRIAPDALDAWVSDDASMAHIEHLRLWGVLSMQLKPRALCQLLARAPWLVCLTLESDAPLDPSIAAALLDAAALEDLSLDPLDARLTTALLDALATHDHPLRLRSVRLYAVDPEEDTSPPRPLVTQLVTTLRERAPGVEVNIHGIPALEDTS